MNELFYEKQYSLDARFADRVIDLDLLSESHAMLGWQELLFDLEDPIGDAIEE